MYRPSQTPRLAVSSDRITPGHVRPSDATGWPRTATATASRRRNADPQPATDGVPPASGRPLNAWLENTVTTGDWESLGARVPPNRVSKETMKVVVFHRRRARRNEHVSHLCYTSHVSLQCQTRVKLNRVFFPR